MEIINSKKIVVNCTERVPSIQIDGCADVRLFLSEESKAMKIIASKSTEMNIEFPGADKEMVTETIPWQFETTIVNNKLVTKPSELV